MIGRKREERKKSKSTREQLQNLGLIPDSDDDGGGIERSDDDDDNLEAELQKLVYGGSKAVRPQKKREAAENAANIESMVAACMADVDEENCDDDDDEDDPELLDELAQFESDEGERGKPSEHGCSAEPVECAGHSLLAVIEERLRTYELAESSAKQAGESMRARRFSRGLSTLKDLRRKVVSGKAVNEDDIPPALSLNAVQAAKPATHAEKPPSLPANVGSAAAAGQPEMLPAGQDEAPHDEAPTAPKRSATMLPPTCPAAPGDDDDTEALKAKRAAFKAAAIQAMKDGDKDAAREGLKSVKLCDALLISKASQEPSSTAGAAVKPPSEDAGTQAAENASEMPAQNPPEAREPPQPPRTAEEALRQRLDRYRADEAKAKEEGNSSRLRRLGRICKQYEEAIVLNKKGKLGLVLSDLPCPPGFGPIPAMPEAAATNEGISSPGSSGQKVSADSDVPVQETPPRQPNVSSAAQGPSPASGSAKVAQVKKPMSVQEEQLAELVKRQGQFKKAALDAKRAGQIEQAREYLKQAKGFDKLIDAASGGLPVDFKTLPVAPQSTKDLAMDFEIVSKVDCTESELSSDSRVEMFAKLEKDLLEQIKGCNANRSYFKSTGDVASSNKFHQMEEHAKKDLDSLRYAFRRGDPVPKFHYEVRSFSKVVCCSDLSDNELEFIIVQGINFNVAKDAHTYCRLEFPYPKETPFRDKTATVKDTNSPQYGHAAIVPLNMKDKSCQRVFKRLAAKVEVWAKAGFLRSDVHVGTAQVRLQPLESKCEIHDSVALMDGRRAVGGQVEVKLRLRNPVLTKQIEKVEEKWLVISFK